MARNWDGVIHPQPPLKLAGQHLRRLTDHQLAEAIDCCAANPDADYAHIAADLVAEAERRAAA